MAGIQNRSDTSALLCAVCTPTFCLLWYLLGITCHVSHQQTLLPVLLPTCGTNQVMAINTETAMFFRSHSPYTVGEEGAQLGCCMGGGLLDQACTAHQHYLPCQDDDPGLHSSQVASLFHTASGEKAAEGPVLPRFSLPVTVLWFACAQRKCYAPECQSKTLGSIWLAV